MKLRALVLSLLLFPGLFRPAPCAGAVPSLPVSLPGTAPLTVTGDLSSAMVAGLDAFLLREVERVSAARGLAAPRAAGSREAWEQACAPRRARLREILGAVDARLPVSALEFVATTERPARLAETGGFTAWAVRWPVFPGVFGEGLWLQPKGGVVGRVVALPDADQTPEMLAGLATGLAPELQFARRLAEQGCEVLVPVLVDRADTWSGHAGLRRYTNQPHREWIYRQAFELGRHVIGYEVQKVLAAVDWLEARAAGPEAGPGRGLRTGVAGYGEGGLLALHAAALDPRVQATLVSGYFDARERIWQEPIYRNVQGLLREFGDAEVASLIAPRGLVVEYAEGPRVDGPPRPRDGRSGAAPGRLDTPEFNSVDAEVIRARQLAGPFRDFLVHVHGNEGRSVGPCGDQALAAFLRQLAPPAARLAPPGPAPVPVDGDSLRLAERQKRQVEELVEHTQRLLRAAQRERDESFWKPIRARSAAEWSAAVSAVQSNLWDRVLGRLPAPSVPAHARSRRILEHPRWTGYDVMLDVYPDVFAWGVLLVPADLKPGERRPVVVCQHGLEGLPADTITEDATSSAHASYRAFAARLAERGFVVFAPHNPYRGGDAFRGLQRKLNPLGLSLFSVILAQHERILDWLAAQPFVDAGRMGFYGLSYGGKTAMRVPALLDRYALSICSADFNEWVMKNASVDSPYSYLYTGEYEIFEWNLGHTFNYAEMAACLAPRPFMVERGHQDGVAPDEWVAAEFARVRRFYARLGVADRAEIEFFNGPHTIHGQGTFRFLHRHLQWPEPAPAGAAR